MKPLECFADVWRKMGGKGTPRLDYCNIRRKEMGLRKAKDKAELEAYLIVEYELWRKRLRENQGEIT